MQTSIIILTYNKLEYTIQCIESIRKYTEKGTYEMIIVDNNSTDGTIDWLKEQEDIIKVYNNSNLGFPKGCNQGVEKATGENILFLNNDVLVTPLWLTNLTSCLNSSKDVAAVGPLTNNCSYYQSIKVEYNNLEGLYKFATSFNIADDKKWERRLKLVGFCYLVKKSVLEEVGLFDEIFSPGNFEDDDLSLRIISNGYKILLCKDTFVHHYGSISFKDNRKGYLELMLRNQEKFEEKWGAKIEHIIEIRKDLISLIDGEEEDNIFNVLQIECGGCGTLMDIKNTYSNANLYGVEMHENALINKELGVEIFLGDIEKINLSYKTRFFDYIFMADLDMSAHRLLSVIDCIKKYLKDAGKLIVTLPISSGEINDFINALSVNFPQSDIRICETRNQYAVLISKRMLTDIEKHFEDIDNDEKIEENITLILEWIKANDDNLSSFFDNIEFLVHNKIALLNTIAVKSYENKLYDFVIPLLKKILDYDEKNKNALVNLSLFLEEIKQYELAFQYIEMVEDKDSEVDEIKRRIVSKYPKQLEVGAIKKTYTILGTENIILDSGATIDKNVYIECQNTNCIESFVKIGVNSRLRQGCYIEIKNELFIGEHVDIGSNVYISDKINGLLLNSKSDDTTKIIIGDNSFIGANSSITGNVSIGKKVYVKPNSFIDCDLPDYCVAGGNPISVHKILDYKTDLWIDVKNQLELMKVLENRKKQKPLISICIPTYNRANDLQKCLDSIFNQIRNSSEWEIVIVNNASSDNTEEIVNGFLGRFDNVFYAKNSVNIGGDRNILKVTEFAHGEFIFLHGDDDFFVEGSLTEIYSLVESNRKKDLIFINLLNNNKTKVDINSVDEFVRLITGTSSAFISSIIMKNSAFKKIEKRDLFINSALNQIYLILTILKDGHDACIYNSSIYYYANNLSGGYEWPRIFTENYIGILNYFKANGEISEITYKFEKERVLKESVLKWFLIFTRQGKLKEFGMECLDECLFKNYKDEPYFNEAYKIIQDIRSGLIK